MKHYLYSNNLGMMECSEEEYNSKTEKQKKEWRPTINEAKIFYIQKQISFKESKLDSLLIEIENLSEELVKLKETENKLSEETPEDFI